MAGASSGPALLRPASLPPSRRPTTVAPARRRRRPTRSMARRRSPTPPRRSRSQRRSSSRPSRCSRSARSINRSTSPPEPAPARSTSSNNPDGWSRSPICRPTSCSTSPTSPSAAASTACSASPSSPTAATRPTSTSPTSTATPSSPSSRSTRRPARFDRDSRRELLTIEQPYANHNGGQLVFGPDGCSTSGSATAARAATRSGNAPEPRARCSARSCGSTRGRRRPARTRVPADNPFVDDAGARPEIWAYGLRNPWRFSFDPATGDLWIGDVGQGDCEEINHSPDRRGEAARGTNFGWSAFEGFERFNDDHRPTARSSRSSSTTTATGAARSPAARRPGRRGARPGRLVPVRRLLHRPDLGARPDRAAVRAAGRRDRGTRGLVAIASGPSGRGLRRLQRRHRRPPHRRLNPPATRAPPQR